MYSGRGRVVYQTVCIIARRLFGYMLRYNNVVYALFAMTHLIEINGLVCKQNATSE